MTDLNEKYKIETARALTELAIENNLIPKYNNEFNQAKAVANFFKTLYENLDNSNKE